MREETGGETGNTGEETGDTGVEPCDAPPSGRSDATDAERIAAGFANALGLTLLRSQSVENPFLAPLNIASALGILQPGAAGGTADEMASLLGDGRGFGELMATLEAASGEPTLECPTWQLAQAENAFVDGRLSLKPDYLAAIQDLYGIEPVTVDFEGDPNGAADAINAWVSENTGGHIDDIADPANFDYHTLAVLGSAVYFAGSWVTPFVHDLTTDRAFTLADGSTVDTSMMSGLLPVRWLEFDHASAVELPYRGDDMTFVLLVPDEIDRVEDVLAGLSADALTFDGSPAEITVTMPRFELEADLALAEALAGAGMPSAFDPFDADLSAMADPPDGFENLYVSAVTHRSWIKLDEAGTEAAAATTIEVDGDDSAPSSITADHPFLYFIRDRVTGAILFAGRFDRPPD